jgi:hypothetical protein
MLGRRLAGFLNARLKARSSPVLAILSILLLIELINNYHRYEGGGDRRRIDDDGLLNGAFCL